MRWSPYPPDGETTGCACGRRRWPWASWPGVRAIEPPRRRPRHCPRWLRSLSRSHRRRRSRLRWCRSRSPLRPSSPTSTACRWIPESPTRCRCRRRRQWPTRLQHHQRQLLLPTTPRRRRPTARARSIGAIASPSEGDRPLPGPRRFGRAPPATPRPGRGRGMTGRDLEFGIYPLGVAGTPTGLATGPPDDDEQIGAALRESAAHPGHSRPAPTRSTPVLARPATSSTRSAGIATVASSPTSSSVAWRSPASISRPGRRS